MRRSFSLIFPLLFVLALIAIASVTIRPASAAPIAGAPTTYCGDPDTDPSMSTGAGTMITCETSIINDITFIDPVTGVPSGSSVIRVTECVGEANGRLDPSELTCTTDEQNLEELVTNVEQCNAVGYGGGNVLECEVSVRNRFIDVVPAAVTDATVNQCNDSAAPDKTGCDPYPATTTDATITQCNNSGGPGQEDFNCIASGTTTATLTVTVNQCNDSNYGGGSWLNCSATLSNRIISTGATGSPVPSPTPDDEPSAAPTDGPPDAVPAPATPAPSASAGTPMVELAAPPTAAATPIIPDTALTDAARAPVGPGSLITWGMLTLAVVCLATATVAVRRRTRDLSPAPVSE